MPRNFVAPGEHFDFTATAAVASGDVVLMTDTIGIATRALAIGETGPVVTENVFTVSKLSTDAITKGQKVYWDNTNKRMTLTSAGNTLAGRAYAAAGAGTTSVPVKINA